MTEILALFALIVAGLLLTRWVVGPTRNVDDAYVADRLAQEAQRCYSDDPRRARRLMEAADALTERSHT